MSRVREWFVEARLPDGRVRLAGTVGAVDPGQALGSLVTKLANDGESDAVIASYVFTVTKGEG